MSTNVEQVVISKIIDDGDMTDFLDAGITTSFFAQERWAKAWEWVYGYWTEHGEMPPATAFRRHFKNIELVEPEEPSSALISELITRRQTALTQEGLGEAISAFDAKDTPGSIQAMIRTITAVNTETSRAEVVRSSQFIGDLVKQAMRPRVEGLLGIPTGFPTIDEATMGFQPEQLITLIAPPKSGKSTISLAMAIAAQLGGWEVEYVTFEMSNTEVQQRYLSIGAQVNLNDILRGGITHKNFPESYDKIQAWGELVADLPDIHLIHDTTSSMTVGGITAKLEQRPNVGLLVVDGAYLMDDENGEPRGSSQALTNITRSLKRLAQRKKITILLTTQALLSRTSRKNGVQLGSIGYTSSFAQDSDVIIGLDREDLSQPTAKLKIIAARNALGREVDLTFDYTIGVIEESGGFAGFRSEKIGYGDDDSE